MLSRVRPINNVSNLEKLALEWITELGGLLSLNYIRARGDLDVIRGGIPGPYLPQ